VFPQFAFLFRFRCLFFQFSAVTGMGFASASMVMAASKMSDAAGRGHEADIEAVWNDEHVHLSATTDDVIAKYNQLTQRDAVMLEQVRARHRPFFARTALTHFVLQLRDGGGGSGGGSGGGGGGGDGGGGISLSRSVCARFCAVIMTSYRPQLRHQVQSAVAANRLRLRIVTPAHPYPSPTLYFRALPTRKLATETAYKPACNDLHTHNDMVQHTHTR
jgi:hypothetical protein